MANAKVFADKKKVWINGQTDKLTRPNTICHDLSIQRHNMKALHHTIQKLCPLLKFAFCLSMTLKTDLD